MAKCREGADQPEDDRHHDRREPAEDQHRLSAYRAAPSGAPKGGLVVVQEIFGVNHHIQGLCDRFAADGYVALAPAIFDRVEPGISLGYTADDIERGRSKRR